MGQAVFVACSSSQTNRGVPSRLSGGQYLPARRPVGQRPCRRLWEVVQATSRIDMTYGSRQTGEWTFTLDDENGRMGTLSATLV